MEHPTPTTLTPPHQSFPPRHPERHSKWFAVTAVMLATTAMVLATTIVNVAIPGIMAHFHLGQEGAQWLSTGFLAAMATTMLTTSWCVKAFGERSTYLWSIGIFIAISLVGGLSDSAPVVILSRVVQGAAGGVVQPLAMMVIFRLFPPEQRGRAMGIYGLGVVLSPAIGPALGGVLVASFGWRAVFFVVLPLCLCGELLAFFFLSDSASGQERPPFDCPGFALLLCCVLTLLLGLRSGQHRGWLQVASLLQLGGAGISGAAFTFRQRRSPVPLVNLATFANREFAAASLVAFAYGMGIYGSTYLIPLFVQTVCRYSPFESGLLLAPGGVVLAFAIFLAGHLTDRHPACRIVGAGLLFFGVSFYLFAGVTAATPFATLAWWIVLGRLGLGLVIPALNVGAMQTLPPELLNQASGAINFVRQLGGAFGVTLLSSVLESRSARHLSWAGGGPGLGLGLQARVAGFQDAFTVVALIFAAALVPAIFMKTKGAHHVSENPARLRR